MKNLVLTSILLIVMIGQAFAQFPPRRDDHFWRRKVVNRINLTEKMNEPLVAEESSYYDADNQYPENQGLIMALLHGLQNGEFSAYNPDSLGVKMTYEDVIMTVRELEGSLTAEDELDEGDGSGGFEDFGAEGGDSWGDESSGSDPWDESGIEDPFADPFAEPGSSEVADDLGGAPASAEEINYLSLMQAIQFVEDRVFDKVRSVMVYDIQMIQMIWVDPGGALPDEYVCVFRYDEVLDYLDKTQWKNRFNDAEYRSMREALEMRLFHSYIIDISGQGISSIEESEYRRQKLVEFEHHLWSY